MNISSILAQSSYYNDYQQPSYTYSETDAAAAAGIFLVFMLFILFMTAITYVVFSLLLSRIFKKAGVETWKAWVPVYNSWTLLELGGQKGFWAILMLIPVVNIVAVVFNCIAMYNIGLKFGKSGEFVLWAIFLPIVWFIWLATDDSKWQDKKPKAAAKA